MRRINRHRLRQSEKRADKPRGFGSHLGKPLPDIRIDWIRKWAVWRYDAEALERQFPKIFSNEFFNNLPRIGGGGEGEVRLLHLGEKNKFISAGGNHYQNLAIKKFKKGAAWSNPERQARTLHSLHTIKEWLVANNMLPKFKFEMRVVETITTKGPYLVMKYVKDAQRLDKIPSPLRDKIWNQVVSFGRGICNVDKRTIEHFKESGLSYPAPDFIPSNILGRMKDGEVKTIYIIDQFTPPGRPETGRIQKTIKESMKRIYQKRPTTTKT